MNGNTYTLTQHQALRLTHLFAEGCTDMRPDGSMVFHIHNNIYDGIQGMLGRVASGELHADPAPTAPAYSQPSMLADQDGSPLFSIGG